MAGNAKSRDAQAGWQLFRESHYEATLEQINVGLVRRGFSPVKQRTYNHFRKLRRYGYQRYVPINVVDVETHRTPSWGSPLRSRYRPVPSSVDVQLIIARESRTFTIDGRTVEISNAEMTLEVETQALTTFLEIDVRSLEGTQALVTFANSADPARSAEIELTYDGPSPNTTTVTLAFLTPVSTLVLPNRQLMPTTDATVTIDVVDSTSPDVFVRTVTALFEALDSARSFTDEVLRRVDSSAEFALPAVSIHRLSISSPLVTQIAAYSAVLRIVAEAVRWFGRAVGRARLEDAKAGYVNELARNLRLKNDVLQRVVETTPGLAVAVVLDEFRQRVPSLADIDLDEEEFEKLVGLADSELLPSIDKLVSPTLNSIDIQHH